MTAILASLSASMDIVVFTETDNECWFNEGATYEGSCTSLFYWYCDQYTLNPGEACNVSTFSDTQLYFTWEQIEAYYIPYGVNTQLWFDSQEAASESTDTTVEEEVIEPIIVNKSNRSMLKDFTSVSKTLM